MISSCDNLPYTTVLTGASAERTFHTVLYGGESDARCSAAMFRRRRDRGGADSRRARRNKVFARATIEPPRLRTLIRLVWQAGTVAWIGGGVLLIAAPWMASEPARHWIVATLAVVFGFAALCNALALRGRHFGWVALSAVVAMAVAGY